MTYNLDQFVSDSRTILRQDGGSQGREQVRRNLERLLANPDFVEVIGAKDAPPGSRLLHDDKELGFRVFAYVGNEAHGSSPHNHGASWAIYGQATQYTEMTEWVRTDDGKGARASLKIRKRYRLSPGQAGIYQDGAIHSVSHPAGARYIRVTGTDLDAIDRERFDLETGEVHNMKKQKVS